MFFLYEEMMEGIRVTRVFGKDSVVEIPEMIKNKPVTELGAYALSDRMDSSDLMQILEQGRICSQDGSLYDRIPDEEPELAGEVLKEILLPSGLKKIGRYAFYNCSKLEKISFYGALKDLGAGTFTGCHKIRWLSVTTEEHEVSCLRELLSELPEEMLVDYYENGKQGRFVFPEYFEEGVENTPARILESHVHGSGMRYRYCFRNKRLIIPEYDEMFYHAKTWEKKGTVLELALGRIMYPMELSQKAEEQYMEYLKIHPAELFENLLEKQEYGFLGQMLEKILPDPDVIDGMLEYAQKKNDTQGTGVVMDYQHRHTKKKRRTFEF